MKPSLIVVLFLLAVGCFYVATFRVGLPPGDDFALYVAHARNIAQGRQYARTGYIYNPHNSRIGPPEYPPMFPLMLSAVYASAGMNFTAMKAMNTVLFLAALLVFYRVLAKELRFGYAFGSIAALALSPYFWNWKDQILSDVPFLLFCYLTLWLSTLQRGPTWIRVGATVLSLYVASATRVVAIIIIPVLIAADLVRWRRVTRATLVISVAGAALIGCHLRAFRGTMAYVDQVSAMSNQAVAAAGSQPGAVRRTAAAVESYAAGIAGCIRPFVWQIEIDLWPSGLGSAFTIAFCLTAAALGIAGYFVRLREGPGVFDIFVAAYVAIVLLWRAADLRLLMPVFPMWVAYAATALSALAASARWRRFGKAAVVLTVAQTALAYGSVYARQNYGPYEAGIADPEFVAMCDHIQRYAPADAVLIAAEPRILALMSQRAASAYYQPKDDDELWEYCRRISATHIVVNTDVLSDRVYLAALIGRGGDRVRQIFHCGKFALYELSPARSLPKTSAGFPIRGTDRAGIRFILGIPVTRMGMVADMLVLGA